MLNSFPRIIAGVSTRLKEARRKLGLSQTDMADLGQVSRSTQLSYETGQTAPTTDYLQVIQGGGADIPLVLYGQAAADHVRQSKINWASIQQAHEDVEFFCMKFAPNCPSSYRWEMVARIYNVHQEKAAQGGASSGPSRQDVLREIWEKQ